MSVTILMEQESTELAGISEHRWAGQCLRELTHEGTSWVCTRIADHPILGLHAAHYEDDRGRSMIGVAWLDEE